jgi:membrane protein YqaA with SNARE-associated domain
MHPLSAPTAGAVHGGAVGWASGRIAGVRWRIRPFAQAADREWAEGPWAAATPPSWLLLPAGIAMLGEELRADWVEISFLSTIRSVS